MGGSNRVPVAERSGIIARPDKHSFQSLYQQPRPREVRPHHSQYVESFILNTVTTQFRCPVRRFNILSK